MLLSTQLKYTTTYFKQDSSTWLRLLVYWMSGIKKIWFIWILLNILIFRKKNSIFISNFGTTFLEILIYNKTNKWSFINEILRLPWQMLIKTVLTHERLVKGLNKKSLKLKLNF